ncbi:hypothetical protein [Noviherbaspirillum sp.]|uniref:hypothetical protein n=1 Tax=Noviherbaspirillum sp. TaxID=1926288 RepID=UPI002D6F5619|nr:hypothetical protein [Noviherbaspirillum sp.]HZW20201.1 hypothetical protein [Noviherbaspirillum sp.]
MNPMGAKLFPHELQALLDALHRDLRMEMSRAEADAEWASYHYRNVRLNVRLIELLAPGTALHEVHAGPVP